MLELYSIPKLARSSALRYFSEVAESGSFRAASESLRIAASAINRQITNLEADLGAKLFERPRGRAGLRLTEAGRILQVRLRLAHNELRIANDEINALQGLQRGQASFGINEVLADEIVGRALERFQQKNPKITYRIVVGNTKSLVDKLREGEIDFAIGYNFPPDGLLFRLSLPLKMYLITSKAHPLATRKYVSLPDLQDCQMIIPDKSFLLNKIIDFASQSAKIKMNAAVETNSLSMMTSLVAANVGVSLVTGRIEFSDSDRSKIAHIELRDSMLPESQLACCTLENRSISAASNAFMEEILTRFDFREFT